jgi:hypothetical protein
MELTTNKETLMNTTAVATVRPNPLTRLFCFLCATLLPNGCEMWQPNHINPFASFKAERDAQGTRSYKIIHKGQVVAHENTLTNALNHCFALLPYA